MRQFKWKFVALAATAILVACGGGSDSPKIQFESLVSFGDSLSDVGNPKVGTIAALATPDGGGRWTVNSAAGGEIWVERLATTLSLPAPCAAETGLTPNAPGLTGAPVTAHTACRNYAQGSARITSPLGPNSFALQALGQTTIGLTAKPIIDQMAAHLSVVGGAYTGKELITVLAGANDVFMELSFLGTSLGAATPAVAVANLATDGATLGTLIKNQVLGKGAKFVLVLNMPDVAGTPFVKSLELATPGTAALVDNMVQAFNAQLAAQLNGVAGVRLADAYTRSKNQAANPSNFGLTNVNSLACGPNALSGSSLVCNATNKVAADTSRWLFADDVHPTPFGHQLFADFATSELVAAGWR